MRHLLLVDASINLVLGLLLLFFPGSLVVALGLPESEQAFYPSILGAVLFGIGIALLIRLRNAGGLGLSGAVAINLSGGMALACWLAFGDLSIPPRGLAGMWLLAFLLVGLSGVEVVSQAKQEPG